MSNLTDFFKAHIWKFDEYEKDRKAKDELITNNKTSDKNPENSW